MNIILDNFQLKLLQSKDQKLAAVDEKITDVITKLSNGRIPQQSTSPVTIPESTCNTLSNVSTVNVEAASNASDNNTPIQNCLSPDSIFISRL